MAETSINLKERIEKDQRAHKEFVARVTQYEEMSRRDPTGYVKMVRRMAQLGMGFLYGTLTVWVSILVAIVVISIAVGQPVNRLEIYAALILLPLIFVTIKALYAGFEPPSGTSLKREDAPGLWSEVDRLAADAGAPPTDEIVMDMDVNAAAYQMPKPLTPWRVKNFLILGLPLMCAATPQEMRSVIAHEFGHFAGEHGKFGGKVYRLGRTFWALQTYFAEVGGVLVYLYRQFYTWFQPRFAAMTFSMNRHQEYEADAAAKRLVGEGPSADLLIKIGVLAEAYSKIMGDFGKLANTSMAPPPEAVRGARSGLSQPVPKETLEKSIRARLALPTTYDDTHPSLSDRLTGLGVRVTDIGSEVTRLTESPWGGAAEALLGKDYERIRDRVIDEYCKSIQPRWIERYRSQVGEAERLRDLELRLDSLSFDERLRRADLINSLRSEDEGFEEYKMLLEERPTDPQLKMRVGYCLLEKDDPNGEPLLREAIAEMPNYASSLLGAIAAFYHRNGRAEDLKQVQEQQMIQSTIESVADQEAASLKPSDAMVPADLTVEKRSELVEEIRKSPMVAEAYVVGKAVSAMNGKIVNHVFVFRKGGFHTDETDSKLWEDVAQHITQNVYLWAPVHGKSWRKAFENVPDSRLI
ncbi:MAG TPA: M48 family metallopeptidase [Fimbriimonadaceae bacterium]|nr:M48 family metallopeptidase [Fimbriimonadaceae bacterium]